jgi:hypothetical protein
MIFFEKVTDVTGDGHYGFYEVVGLCDMFVDDYYITHYELLKELTEMMVSVISDRLGQRNDLTRSNML